MPSPEARAQRAAERAAFHAWWSGDRRTPFVLTRREEYCVCDVLFPGLRTVWRYGIIGTLGYLAAWLPGSTLKVFAYRILGARIGPHVYLAPGVILDPLYPELVEIEDNCFLGLGCRVYTHEYTATSFRLGRVRLGRGSVIGGHATVRSGVTIGAKATVGFDSLVNKDVREGATVGGVPARELRADDPPRKA
jgi:acetyltransferase-like isoleucine patch superfamily enzyme